MRAPCEHGHYDYHVTRYDTTGQVMEECEGWREIVIDLEAGAEVLKDAMRKPWPMDLTQHVQAIVDATLGKGTR